MAAGDGINPTVVQVDARGDDRALRITWHLDRRPGDRRPGDRRQGDAEDEGRTEPLVVLSLWRGNVCSGSFRLRRAEVPGLIAFLADGLDVLERREVAADLAEAAQASNEGDIDVAGHADAG